MGDGPRSIASGGRRVRAEELRSGHLIAALLTALACPAGAAASEDGLSLDLGLTTGGGYDSNVFMDYEGSASPGVIGSPFASASPEAALTYESRRATVSLPFSASLRYFTKSEAGLAAYWDGRPGITFRAGALSLSAAGVVEGYMVSSFSEDDNLFYGGDSAIEVRPSDAWGVYAAYDGGVRVFGERTDAAGSGFRDTEHRGSAGAMFAPVRAVALKPRYVFERISGADGSLDQTNHEASLKVVIVAGRRFSLSPFARAKFKSFDLDGRTDRLLNEGLTAEYRFAGWLACSLHASRTDNLSSETGMSYGRNLLQAALEFTVPVRLGRETPVWAENIPETSLLPRVADGNVEFFLRAPSAADVRIIGSFNAWEPGGVPMRRRADGTWSVALPRTGADIVYHFLVDGAAVIPPESPMLAEDGFGGFNGVVPAH